MLVRLLQYLNAPLLIVVTPSGMVTTSSFPQYLHRISPKIINPSSSFNPSHSSNASTPIYVTLFGNVIPVRLLHPLNAKAPINSTPSGMTTLVSLLLR